MVPPTQAVDRAYSVRQAVAALFRQMRVMGFVFVAVLIAITSIILLLPNRYEAQAKILVKNARADAIVSPEQGKNIQLSSEVSEAQINSEIELIRSRNLLEAVAKQAGLAAAYAAASQQDPAIALDKAIRQLEKDLAIAPVKKSNVITLSYSAASPQQAESVLKTITELYLERHLQVHRVPGTDQFFQEQAHQAGQKLKDAEAALLRFETGNNIVALNLQKDLGLKRVIEAENEWQTALTGREETAQRSEKIKQQLQTLTPRVTTQQRTIPQQYSIDHLTTLQVEQHNKRTQLLTRFQADDRLVKELEQQIADTSVALERIKQQQLVEQVSDLNPLRQSLELELARAQAELRAKDARIESLAKIINLHRSRLSALEGNTLKHAELEREVAELKENYQLFTKKRDEALITDALDKQKISNVSLAETPVVPALPASPNRKLSFMLGFFLAAFLGMSSGIGAEFISDSIHTPQELEAISSYPVLATIPYVGLTDGGPHRGALEQKWDE